MTDHTDGALGPAPTKSGPGRPRKRRDATTEATVEDFEADDAVRNLKAVKTRLAEMLSRPDIHERDLVALSREYRAVSVDLHEEQLQAEARALTASDRPHLRALDRRRFDGDI